MTQHASQTVSGISITQRILGLCLLVIALVIAVLLAMTTRQFNASIQKQADALGEAMVLHTAQAVTTPLVLSDSLASAAVLHELVNNPYVAHAALYTVDNRTVAEAGQRPRQGKINSLYTRSIVLEQVIAGQLHINIDVKRLQQPLYGNVQGLLLLGILLLIVAVVLLSRIARSISQPLLDLQRWLIQPIGPAPHQQRNDEIGLLARTLGPCFDLPTATAQDSPAETPATANIDIGEQAEITAPPETPATHTEEPAPAEEPVQPLQCAVLAVELNLEREHHLLDEQLLQQLLDHYAHALEEVAGHYQGRLLELSEHQALLLFHDDHEQHVINTLCAAELLRTFTHALQMDVAASGITLRMQLGVAHGDSVTDFDEHALRQHPVVAQALNLASQSRNLVLLDQNVAGHAQAACASIRPLARPAGASCIERMLPPWPEQLDMQLQDLVLNPDG